jgi:hypothetical protein
MSISGIANTALSSLLTATQSAQNGQGNFQQIQSEFQQLGQDLQAGNLTQAQQDCATIQQDFQQQQGAGQVHHHHHHGGGAGGQQGSQVSQALNSFSTALQAGNLSRAQTAFAELQQDLEQFSTASNAGSTSGTASTSSQTGGSGLNVTAWQLANGTLALAKSKATSKGPS